MSRKLRAHTGSSQAGGIWGLVFVILAGCGSQVTGHGGSDSESHFLHDCDEGECPSGLTCLCGVCTESCVHDEACSALAAPAVCTTLERSGAAACANGPTSVCDVACATDSDCGALDEGYLCDGGHCHSPRVAARDPNDFIVNAAIWGAPEGDLFAIGYHGMDSPASNQGFVKKLRNHRWVVVHETPADLWGISGTSSSDYFVFGGSGRAFIGHEQSGLLSDTTPSWTWPDKTDSTIRGIWAASPTDVFTVGRQATVTHFDGSSWTPVDVPVRNAMGGRENYDLQAIWGSSPSDIFITGANGTILHYNGTSWDPQAAPSSGASPKLQGIWGSAPDDVFVIGETEAEQSHVILHWDGSAWSTMHEGPRTLLGIHGIRHDCVYAVGGQRIGDAVQSGVFFFDGSSWRELPDATGQFLWDVWVTPDCGFYAVGPNDTIVRHEP